MNYLYTTMMYINVLWTQMSRQWMYMADRRSKEFIDGVHEFIEAAEKHNYKVMRLSQHNFSEGNRSIKFKQVIRGCCPKFSDKDTPTRSK